ncbi:MAG: serine hydrolase domain-containing protein [Candidatus Acidiferrales bacterium]
MKCLSLLALACIASLAIAPQARAGRSATRGTSSVLSDASDATLSPQVDLYVDTEIKAQKIPGLALAIVRDGKIVKAKGYGLANVELDVPVKPETLFQTGSVGKQFTATAVMMLVEEGKVGLDDKITKYFPDVPVAWQEITVRNLLSHTSGIPDYTGEDKSGNEHAIDFRKDYTEDDLLKKAESLPMLFKPGEKWSYSNTGYVVLGILIHRVTGEFYGDFLQQRIFKPLGMSATRIISEADIVPNRSSGYRLVDGALKNQEWVSPSLNTTADGSLYTNVVDMSKWDAALYTDKLLKTSSLAEMWTPMRLNDGQTCEYGFGWFIHVANGHRLIEHAGSWQGFTTQISRYVGDKFTIIVLTNLDSEHSNPGKIAHHIAGMYIPAVAGASSTGD